MDLFGRLVVPALMVYATDAHFKEEIRELDSQGLGDVEYHNQFAAASFLRSSAEMALSDIGRLLSYFATEFRAAFVEAVARYGQVYSDSGHLETLKMMCDVAGRAIKVIDDTYVDSFTRADVNGNARHALSDIANPSLFR